MVDIDSISAKEALREKLAKELLARLEDDAFFATDFFSLMTDITGADEQSIEQLKAFKLVDMIAGKHRAEIKRVVGKKTEDVIEFVLSVAGDSKVTNDDGEHPNYLNTT